MKTWQELGSAFVALEGGRSDARLEYQWSTAGEQWRITANATRSYVHQFDALAYIAGLKILESPVAMLEAEVSNESDATKRWYRALVCLSGCFEHRLFWTQPAGNGRPAGNIYSGTVHALSQVAANLCLTLDAQAGAFTNLSRDR